MAAIADTWNTASPAGGDALSTGDDKIRELKRAIEERMKNMGADWPAGSVATSGILRVSADNYVANEFNVYASDESTKQLTITDTAISLNDATTVDDDLAVTGDLTVTGSTTQGGNAVLDEDTHKRLVVITFSTDAGEEPEQKFRAVFPPGIAAGTVKSIFIVRESTVGSVAEFIYRADFDGSSQLSLGQVTINSGDTSGYNNSPTNTTFTSANGLIVYVTSSISNVDEVTVGAVLELDW